MIPTDCDALHYDCTGCGHHTCADERPSPAEAQRVCADCAPLMDGLRGWGGEVA